MVAFAFATPLPAQQAMNPAPAVAPTSGATMSSPAMTNGVPVAQPPPDTFNRFGKIITTGDDAAHPLKLKMPFPGVGEVKVPNQDEMKMREKLEELAKLSDADIRQQLEQWPAYGKMSLRDEGTMLQRIQDFRDYRTKLAMQKAHDMGLLTLTPEQKVRFEAEYWDKRLQLDHDLAKQFDPIYRDRMQKMQDELFRDFSSSSAAPIATPTPANHPGATLINVSAPAPGDTAKIQPPAPNPR